MIFINHQGTKTPRQPVLSSRTHVGDDNYRDRNKLVSWCLGGLNIFFVLLFLSTSAHARDKFLDIQEVTSPGGITAWFVEDHSVPVLSIEFSFKGAGAALDPEDKQGVARLLSNTMDEGAGDLDSQTFQKTLTDESISLTFSSSRDHFSGHLKTLTRNRDKAFELARLALAEPRFDEEPVNRMRDANLTRIKSSLTDPDWIAARIMNDIAYAGHVYARNSGGTLSSLQAITPDDLRAFKEAYLTKDRLLVTAVGDISAEELTGILDTIFGGLPARGMEVDTPDAVLKGAGEITLHEKDIPQTVVEILMPGIGRNDPDYYNAQVMNFIFGGSGFGSRLTEEIREKRGLTYGIYSYFAMLDHAPGYAISSSTKNESVAEMLALIDAEMKKMRDEPITEKELADAKSYLIGSMPLMLSSTDKIAGLLMGLRLDGLPVDYLDRRAERLESVGIQDVQNAAQRLLVPGAQTVVLVGQPQGVSATQTVEILPNVE